jgi:hypothetical protein
MNQTCKKNVLWTNYIQCRLKRIQKFKAYFSKFTYFVKATKSKAARMKIGGIRSMDSYSICYVQLQCGYCIPKYSQKRADSSNGSILKEATWWYKISLMTRLMSNQCLLLLLFSARWMWCDWLLILALHLTF